MALAGRRWLPREIAELLWENGWRDKNLIIMVAVVLQESEGYSEATNLNPATATRPASEDWGMVMLNSLGAESWGFTKASAFDPPKAVKVARAMFDKRQFQPWAAFNSGRYLERDYMQRAIDGVRNMWRARYGIGIAG